MKWLSHCRPGPARLSEGAIEGDVAGRADRLEPARLPGGGVVDFTAGVAGGRHGGFLSADWQSGSQNAEKYEHAVQAK